VIVNHRLGLGKKIKNKAWLKPFTPFESQTCLQRLTVLKRGKSMIPLIIERELEDKPDLSVF